MTDLCDDAKLFRRIQNHNTQSQAALVLLGKINEDRNDGYMLLTELHSESSKKRSSVNSKPGRSDRDHFDRIEGVNFDSYYQMIQVLKYLVNF
jgi:hypothetical protein